MNASNRSLTSTGKIALAIGACIAIAGATIASRNLLAEEGSAAAALVAEGQRDFARNDRAAAVLAFERARWFAPRSAEVRAAIRGLGVEDAEAPVPRLLRLVTGREWAAIATTSGWISGLAIALLLVRRSGRTRWTAIAAGATFATAMIGLLESNVSAPAVVTGADAHLLIAPYAAAAAEGTLPAGTMVLVGNRYADFVRVREPDGQAGWARSADIERVASAPD